MTKQAKVNWSEAIKEFQEKEHSYLDRLMIIDELFYQPLHASKILNGQQRKMVIPKVGEMIKLHQDFCNALDIGVKEDKIGERILPYAKQMNIYIRYVNDSNMISGHLKTHRETNQPFAEFLDQQRRNPRCNRLDIADLLIEPVQHVPRIVLQLEAILKHMPMDHPDLDNIEASIAAFRDVAKQMDVAKSEEEARLKTFWLKGHVANCPDNIIKNDRSFVGEFDFDEVDPQKWKVRRSLRLYLFNDVLLVVNKIGKQPDLHFMGLYDLNRMNAIQLADDGHPGAIQLEFTLKSEKKEVIKLNSGATTKANLFSSSHKRQQSHNPDTSLVDMLVPFTLQASPDIVKSFFTQIRGPIDHFNPRKYADNAHVYRKLTSSNYDFVFNVFHGKQAYKDSKQRSPICLYYLDKTVSNMECQTATSETAIAGVLMGQQSKYSLAFHGSKDIQLPDDQTITLGTEKWWRLKEDGFELYLLNKLVSMHNVLQARLRSTDMTTAEKSYYQIRMQAMYKTYAGKSSNGVASILKSKNPSPMQPLRRASSVIFQKKTDKRRGSQDISADAGNDAASINSDYADYPAERDGSPVSVVQFLGNAMDKLGRSRRPSSSSRLSMMPDRQDNETTYERLMNTMSSVIDYIEQSLDTDGLYSVNANHRHVEQALKMFSKKPESFRSKNFDVHTVAQAFKSWVSANRHVFMPMDVVKEACSYVDEVNYIPMLGQCLGSGLPFINAVLFQHLKHVVENENSNFMSAERLANCWATFLLGESYPDQTINVLTTMIMNAEEVFPNNPRSVKDDNSSMKLQHHESAETLVSRRSSKQLVTPPAAGNRSSTSLDAIVEGVDIGAKTEKVTVSRRSSMSPRKMIAGLMNMQHRASTNTSPENKIPRKPVPNVSDADSVEEENRAIDDQDIAEKAKAGFSTSPAKRGPTRGLPAGRGPSNKSIDLSQPRRSVSLPVNVHVFETSMNKIMESSRIDLQMERSKMESEIINLRREIDTLKKNFMREIQYKGGNKPGHAKRPSQSVAVGTDDLAVDGEEEVIVKTASTVNLETSSVNQESRFEHVEELLSQILALYNSQVTQTSEKQKLIAAEVQGLLEMYREVESENSKLRSDLMQLQKEKEDWIEREAELTTQLKGMSL